MTSGYTEYPPPKMPKPALSAGQKTLAGGILALLVMLGSYLGLQSPCPECPVCPAPVVAP